MKKLLPLLLCFLGSITLSAQNAGDADPAFTIGNSINSNGDIRALTVQPDGKTIVAGNFYDLNGISTGRIVRLNLDGTRDATFITGAGFNTMANYLALQADGKIIVGGDFNSYDGTTANRIIRLNSNGSIDTSFNMGSGFNASVYALAIQSDGKIIVGGGFTSYNGIAANKIIRLNTDGTADGSFITGTGFDSHVLSLLLQPDGKIIIGGLFVTYQGVAVNNILLLNADGSLAFSGTGCNGGVYGMAFQPDGKLIMVGNFTTFAGIPSNHVVRLNLDATVDTSFNTGTGFDDFVRRVAVQPDGKIILAGNFTSFNGTVADRITRLNSDGTKDSSFAIGSGFNANIQTIALQADGKIIAGGMANFYNGISGSALVRLNSNGAKDTGYNVGLFISGSYASVLALQGDGKIIVGGNFNSYFGSPTNGIVRLNKVDGSIDTSFNTGTGFSYSQVLALAFKPNGKIVAGGSFRTFNGNTSRYIAVLNSDGSQDNSFTSGTGFDSTIYTLAVQNDGKIIAGGNFSSYNGTASNKIIRLNTDGTIDSSFSIGTGFDYEPYSIVFQADGKIIVGGFFNLYNGISKNNLVRLNADGSIDNSFNIGSGFNSGILSMAIQATEKFLFVGISPLIIRLRPTESFV